MFYVILPIYLILLFAVVIIAPPAYPPLTNTGNIASSLTFLFSISFLFVAGIALHMLASMTEGWRRRANSKDK